MNDSQKKNFILIIKFIIITIINDIIKFSLIYKNDIYDYIKYNLITKFK